MRGKGHAEHIVVFLRRVGIEQVQRHRLRIILHHGRIAGNRGLTARVVVLGGEDRWRQGISLLPCPQRAQLRIEREHVAGRGGAGARQAADHDRPANLVLAGLRVFRVPCFDLEPVLQTPQHCAQHPGAARTGNRVAFGRKARKQLIEALDEFEAAEIG